MTGQQYCRLVNLSYRLGSERLKLYRSDPESPLLEAIGTVLGQMSRAMSDYIESNYEVNEGNRNG